MQEFIQHIFHNDENAAHECVLVMAKKKSHKALYGQLEILLVTHKFPDGVNHLFYHQKTLRDWPTTPDQQRNALVKMARLLARLPSDDHVLNLATVAFDFAFSGEETHRPELRLARRLARALVWVRRKTEISTRRDLAIKDVREMLKIKNGIEAMLFGHFEATYDKMPQIAPLFLYALVARRFYEHSRPTDYVSVPSVPSVPLSGRVGSKRKLSVSTEPRKRSRGHTERSYLLPLVARINAAAGLDPELVRQRRRYTPDRIKGEAIVATEYCGKNPHKKPTMLAKTATRCFWLKGPYLNAKKLQYQIDIDRKKAQYGLTPIEIEIIREDNRYYLCAPPFQGTSAKINGKTDDQIVYEIVRILVFRAAFRICNTTLDNILIGIDGGALSISEPKGERPSQQLLFSKASKAIRGRIKRWISENQAAFREEIEKYGDSARKLL